MTDRELLQQALDALDYYSSSREYVEDIYVKAHTAIEARLAQPDGVMGDVRVQIHTGERWIRDSQLEALIATGILIPPIPKKEWVGLTDEEIIDIWAGVSTGYDDEINILHLGKAIEAKLKEKNT